MTEIAKTSPNSPRDYSDIAWGYAEDVVNGVIPACLYIRQACQRTLDDWAKSNTPDFPYVYDPVKAHRACRFIENCAHVEGELAGQLIVMQPWQVWIITQVFGWVAANGPRAGFRRFRRAYIEVPKGNGKALAIDTPIPTPSGWSTMGALNVGDKVFSPNGSITTIIAATDVMYDRDCYSLKTNTGETIIADANHLWKTKHSKQPERLRNVRGKRVKEDRDIVTTREISETIYRWGKANVPNHMLPLTKAVKLPDTVLPIDPYILGYWLGDGSSSGPIITIGMEDIDDIRRILADAGENIQQIRNGLNYRFGKKMSEVGQKLCTARILRNMNLIKNKHIPDIYLRASEGQRLALLQGLMDSDGTCSKVGQCIFTNTKKAIIDGITELAWSLGLKPVVKEHIAHLYDKACGKVWDVSFGPRSDVPVFRIKRKLNRQQAVSTKTKFADSRTIKSCDLVDSVPVRCIQIANEDGMFLCGKSFIPTHNSAISSPVGLYMLAGDGDQGAQVYSAATGQRQARIVFDVARQMAMQKASSNLMRACGITVQAHTITVKSKFNRFAALSSEGRRLDGLNISCAIVDELHAHPDRHVFDNLVSGAAKRPQSLIWMITTAGFDLSGIGYEQRTYVTKILDGSVNDDSTFGSIWTVDETDDWQSEDVWKKANPNWNISVEPDAFRAEARQAVAISSTQPNFLTKHLNVWCTSSSKWANIVAWKDALEDGSLNSKGERKPVLTIDQFERDKTPCWIGCDLSSHSDMTAVVKVFKKQIDKEDHYYLFPTFYLPDAAIRNGKNASYAGWVRDGHLVRHDGETIDISAVQKDIERDYARFNVQQICFDKYEARQIMQNLTNERLPVTEISQSALALSEPTKLLDASSLNRRLHYINPIMLWCASNVYVRIDTNGNIKPNKENNYSPNKIDGIAASVNAMCYAMQGPKPPSKYDTGDLIVF